MHFSSKSSLFLLQLFILLDLWASWKELKEQACYITCPDKTCAEELCPKYSLALWRSKYKVTFLSHTQNNLSWMRGHWFFLHPVYLFHSMEKLSIVGVKLCMIIHLTTYTLLLISDENKGHHKMLDCTHHFSIHVSTTYLVVCWYPHTEHRNFQRNSWVSFSPAFAFSLNSSGSAATGLSFLPSLHLILGSK